MVINNNSSTVGWLVTVAKFSRTAGRIEMPLAMDAKVTLCRMTCNY